MAKANKHITPSMRKACEGCGVVGCKQSKGLCKGCSAVSRKGMRLLDRRRQRGVTETMPRLTTLIRRIPKSECNVCGKTYRPKTGDRTTACSRECGFVWSGFKTTLKRNGGRVWVSALRNKAKPEVQEPKIYYEPVTHSSCRCCGQAFDRRKEGTSMWMCSQSCRDKFSKKSKRIARKKRKAIERGAQVGSSVDPIDVFERDGWRCQMCRCKTPSSKRGTYHKRAPELDHIMPLSLGGEHSYRNTQCLCRSCNASKSNTPMGQLSLL